MSDSNRTFRVRMNLRLWSDTRDLKEIADDLNITPKYLYKMGELIHTGPQQRPHLPKRHYASFPELKVHEFSKVEPWLTSAFYLLEESELTASLIWNGTVEAVAWIAIFANRRVDPPALSNEIVQRARALGLKILIENYSYDPSLGLQVETSDADAGPAHEMPTDVVSCRLIPADFRRSAPPMIAHVQPIRAWLSVA